MRCRSILALCGLALFTMPVLAADYTSDTAYDIRKNIQDQKAILLDVREQEEWNQGHLTLARLLSLSKLKDPTLGKQLVMGLPKDKTIYLHCKSGGRCMQAAELLEKMGYKVSPIKQGYEDLLKAGFSKAEK